MAGSEPRQEYDILIIGGGGHGLSTAYYLAKNHDLQNIAVLEKVILEEAMLDGIQRLLEQITLPGNSEFILTL